MIAVLDVAAAVLVFWGLATDKRPLKWILVGIGGLCFVIMLNIVRINGDVGVPSYDVLTGCSAGRYC